MRLYCFETTLRLDLGGADKELAARIHYLGGPFQADLQRIEVQQPSGFWAEEPRLLDVYADCPVMLDRLREHTGDVLMSDRVAQVRARHEACG